MECRELEGFIDAYLDGEFDGLESREVEMHLEGCEPCQQLAATQARFKALVHDRCSGLEAPADLEEKVHASLLLTDLAARPTADDLALFGEATVAPRPRMRPSWRKTGPVFASAAFALGFFALTTGGFLTENDAPVVVDDAVDKHLKGLPMEASGDLPNLQGWVRGKVDFHPRLPAFGKRLQPEGVRLSHIVDRPAVYLRYSGEAGGRASLFAFVDPSLALEELPEARRLRQDVVLTTRKGVNVVMWRNDEVVYSLVSDLDERELLRLVDTVR